MVRWVLALGLLAAVTAAAVAIIDTKTSGPPRPLSLALPRVTSTPWPSEDFVVVSPRRDWRLPGAGSLKLSYSWLRCDLNGKHCVPLLGLRGRRIVPPQELRIVTVRAVVTASDGGGSTTVVSRNFYFDEAGRARARRKDLYPLAYDPDQLRHRYGLRPLQDGAGQTIVILAHWKTRGLREAVDRFSALFSLPLVCGTRHAGRNCFTLRDTTLGPTSVADSVEDEDIEWVHAIAPKAKIVVLRSGYYRDLGGGVLQQERLDDAHVFSASWGYHPNLPARFLRDIYSVARDCHHAHVVCTLPSGHHGQPGDKPSNSPDVLAVGGTVFRPRPDGVPGAEAYWPHGGFGRTTNPQPRTTWQRDVSDRYRVVPDVSATAAGVGEYEVPPGTPDHQRAGWFFGGGTSLSSPLWAALIALADQDLARGAQPAIGIDELHTVLYRGWLSSGLDDLGHRGWSERTGWGSPRAGIVDVLVHAIERYRQEH
jgi:Subtilase family